MKYELFKKSDSHGVIDLLNRSFGGELLYKPFTEQSFANKFLNQPDFSYEGTFVALDGDKIVGFANGIFRKHPEPIQSFEEAPGYVTMILVDKAYRNHGIGGKLLELTEQYLKQNGKSTYEMKFFNPINLEWIVPGTQNHSHPNAPGVLLDSPAYLFFEKRGFVKQSVELSYHLDLKDFSISEKYENRLHVLNEFGITVEYYDARKHSGFDKLFDGLKNEYWRKDINDNLTLEHPLPILVAADHRSICGYAGPIAVEESGRGWFAGIGVSPDHEGKSLGTILFLKLMQSFKELGAGYSTLFTGIENPARNIYERAGFSIVAQWAVMKKDARQQ